jgi:hypothetical protein
MFFEMLLFLFMMKNSQEIEEINERLDAIETIRLEHEDEELGDLR